MLKIHILLCGNNLRAVELTVRNMGYRTVEEHEHTHKMYVIIILFDEALNMAMVRSVEVMLEQLLIHSVYNSVSLCNVVSL
jgi:hypothetical protein